MGVLRPSGPLPASVYWRRRAVVLLAVIAVLVLLVVGVRALTSGGGAGDDPAAADPTPSPSASASADGTTMCEAQDLQVTLKADATDYPAGAQPVFTVSVTNTSDRPCLVDAGDPQRKLEVTSGSDRIWGSTDCGEGESVQLLLAAGQSDDRQVQWDRTRSDAECTEGLPAPGAGTYQAVVSVAGAASEAVVFTLQ